MNRKFSDRNGGLRTAKAEFEFNNERNVRILATELSVRNRPLRLESREEEKSHEE